MMSKKAGTPKRALIWATCQTSFCSSALLFLAQSSEMRGPREAFTANWAKVIRLPILKATR